jgi:hypothetical protein
MLWPVLYKHRSCLKDRISGKVTSNCTLHPRHYSDGRRKADRMAHRDVPAEVLTDVDVETLRHLVK